MKQQKIGSYIIHPQRFVIVIKGMSVLGNLIEYKDDMYKTLFQQLRMNCLTKYGTRLFTPSYCNYPDSLQMLMDSLYSMGIDIND